MTSKIASSEPYLRSALRFVAGFLFTLHGAQKIMGAFGGIDGMGTAAPSMSLFWFAGVLELIGGPLIAAGLFTRPVAFVLAGEMAVAYFQTHAPMGFWPITNGGEPAALFCFVFLWLWAAGPGPWSLDRVTSKRLRPI